jgi:hypothetical protein
MANYFSYGEQAGHYFDRPHATIPREPVVAPAAWRGLALERSLWHERLSAGAVDEIQNALAVAKSTGKATGDLAAEDFPLPLLAADVARWRAEVQEGLGFRVISGIPVERMSDEDAGIVFWCLGLHFGRPGAQNADGDLLGHVADTGDSAEDPFVRLYRTKADIAYHCDAADVVGLLCLRRALRGGASRIVSSVSVYNELVRRRPDLCARLFEPFLVDLRNEDASGTLHHVPVPPCRFADGRLRTFYHSDYFRSVVRHDDVPEFSDEERELLDLYEEIANDPAWYLDMELEPGDIQLVSNHTVLHARTAYEDHADPAEKRHLLRLWLSIEAD